MVTKMQFQDELIKTMRSKDLLEQARRYLEEANSLSKGDEKREWLEKEAQLLINKARNLTKEAKAQIKKYK